MKKQIYTLIASIFVSISALFLLVSQSEPQFASNALKVLFFLSLFVAIWGSVSMLIFYISSKRQTDIHQTLFSQSFFIGLYIAVGVIGTLLIYRL